MLEKRFCVKFLHILRADLHFTNAAMVIGEASRCNCTALSVIFIISDIRTVCDRSLSSNGRDPLRSNSGDLHIIE